MSSADARIFTQEWYRDELFGRVDNSLVAPAVWIDDSVIQRGRLRSRIPGPLRLIFPTRLVAEKGIETVLSAIRYLNCLNGPSICIDIVGDGPMAGSVKDFIVDCRGRVKVSFSSSVPYGEIFYGLLRNHDAVLIASVTEEQPRIAFDAFSQGIPCIASGTSGNKSVIEEGSTGLLFDPGDYTGLAALIADLSNSPERLFEMKGSTLAFARKHSHLAMHRDRERFLKDTLNLTS